MSRQVIRLCLSDVRMKKETDSPLLYIGLKQEVTIIYAGS